jgi:hypothetical protein
VIGTTEQVIKNYLRNTFDKLGVWSRLELALYVAAHGGAHWRGPVVVPLQPVAVTAEASPSPGKTAEPADPPVSKNDRKSSRLPHRAEGLPQLISA